MRAPSRSCSSEMSPTISSTTSSSVTMPAWPPYSSSTMAIWKPSWRSSAISGSSRRLSGTTTGLTMTCLMRVVARSCTGTATACLTCTVPTTVSSASSTGKREWPVWRARSMTGGDPVAVLDGGGPHAGGHDLAGRAGAELDRALDELGGVGVEGALVGRPLHERGELLRAPGGAELLLRLDAEAAHDRVGRPVERPDRSAREGGEAAHEALGAAGGLQRPGDGDVLGHHLAEDHRHHGAEDQAECRARAA